jgi:hypothetical protein
MQRIVGLVLPCLLATTALVSANEVDCATPSGATVAGGAVAADADFTTGDGFITVIVNNDLADPRSAGQLLSDVEFTISDGETTGTLGANSANLRRVAAQGVFTDLGPAATGWALQSSFNGGMRLCVLCTGEGAVGPSHLLIGPPAGSGSYASANASIAGNKPHNPFTSGPATYLLNVPGGDAEFDRGQRLLLVRYVEGQHRRRLLPDHAAERVGRVDSAAG